MRGLFVTGTDTGVGKTVLAGAIAAALTARGHAVAAFKPVVTGADEPTDPAWPADDELLATATGRQAPGDVAPNRFAAPLSPHLATRLAGAAPLRLDDLLAAGRAAAAGADVLVVEGVGGLLVPLADDLLVRDLARALGLPLVVAARPGLGTINHSLLTLEAARAAGLRPAAVVLTPWPDAPEPIHTSNRDTIARLGDVEVATLPRARSARPADLAAAAARLGIEGWLGG